MLPTRMERPNIAIAKYVENMYKRQSMTFDVFMSNATVTGSKLTHSPKSSRAYPSVLKTPC
jgi:hypothetical protein